MAKQEVKTGRCEKVSEILNGRKVPGVFDFLDSPDMAATQPIDLTLGFIARRRNFLTGKAEAQSIDGAGMIEAVSDVPEKPPELQKVQNFFNSLADELNYGQKGVFENLEVQEDFKKRLDEFIAHVDKEIGKLSDYLQGSEYYNNFSNDWQSHVRMACYYSFFVHYGAKRRGEVDKHKNPRDYVYHVTRTGFNCLMRKMRFFDEQSLMAAFLHDTREDYRKGFCGLIMAEPGTKMSGLTDEEGKKTAAARECEERAVKKEAVIFEKFKGFEECLDNLNNKRDPREVSLSDLIDILTKSSDDRMRALLKTILKICDMKPSKKRFSAIKALMVKMADRLDNIKSFTSGPDGRQDKVTEIEDETTLIFMLLCSPEFLNMPNVYDFFMDYIWFKDNPDERRAYTQRDREYDKDLAKPEHTLRMEMKVEFAAKLSEKLGRKVVEGRDYVFQFRDRGHRYEDKIVVMQEKQSGEYSKAFRGYIIFHPVGEDKEMADCGREIFNEIFRENMPGKELDRREIKNARLGKVVVGNGAAGYDSKKYGAGVWCAFDSQQTAVYKLMGGYHLAYLFSGDMPVSIDLEDRILTFFDVVAPRVRFLVEQYEVLDRLENDLKVVEQQQLVIGDKAARVARLRMRRKQPFENLLEGKRFLKGSTKGEVVPAVKKLLSDLAKTLFLQPVRLVGVNLNRETRDVIMPSGIAGHELMPLLFAAPLMLGRDVKTGKSGMSFHKLRQSFWQAVREVFHPGSFTEVDVYARTYTVAFHQYDSGRAESQVGPLRAFLAEKKADILREEGIPFRRVRANSGSGRGKPRRR